MEHSNTPILFPYEPNELWEKIREIIRSELSNNKNVVPATEYSVPGLTQKPLFKAAEVCEMLQVSRQTLHAWTKEGILKGYKIKSRVFYLWTDIEKLIGIEKAR